MDKKIVITKKDIENMRILTDEEIKKLNFNELCMYYAMLDMAKKVLGRGE